MLFSPFLNNTRVFIRWFYFQVSLQLRNCGIFLLKSFSPFTNSVCGSSSMYTLYAQLHTTLHIHGILPTLCRVYWRSVLGMYKHIFCADFVWLIYRLHTSPHIFVNQRCIAYIRVLCLIFLIVRFSRLHMQIVRGANGIHKAQQQMIQDWGKIDLCSHALFHQKLVINGKLDGAYLHICAKVGHL